MSKKTKTKKELLSEIDELKKTKTILVKRDRALRERFAYMMWLQFIDNFNCDESATVKELDRLDSCYQQDQELKTEKPDIKLFYLNRNWFVNKHLDAFLSQFS
jgi:5'-deoxynucleotidase YfbR-like HD superfamily hydrolase